MGKDKNLNIKIKVDSKEMWKFYYSLSMSSFMA